MFKCTRLITSVVALFTLLACSSDSPVGLFSERFRIEKARSWGDQYKNAVALLASQPAQACATFQNLATDPGSTIAELASARSLASCQSANLPQALASLDQMHDDPRLPWLKPMLAESIINLALSSRALPLIVKYAFNRSKQLGSQREKEQLLNEAISAAGALNLANKVAEFQSELYRISPRLKPSPVESEWLKAADDHRTNEEWDGAMIMYNRLLASAQTSVMDRFRALDGIRQVYKSKFRFYEGPVAEFLEASKRVADFTEDQVLHSNSLSFDERRVLYEAWIQYARDEWSYGDVAIAHREIGLILAESSLEAIFKCHAYWTLSRVFANTSDWVAAADAGEQAAQILQAELANASSWGKWQWTLWDDSLWATSLAHRKLQDWTASANVLDLALRHTQNANAEIKFTFWLAQSLKDQGISTAAETYFQKLAQDDPYGFYGFLAYRELHWPMPALPDLDLENIQRPSSVSQSDYELLVSLSFAGEMTLAQRYSQKVLNPNSVAIEDLLLRAFVHDYSTILNLYFDRIPAADRNAFTAKYARLFYPQPFKSLVDAAVTRNPRVTKEYVYSIMRQESGFNPLSHSWANAYGLLQLLPQVARDSQAKAGVTFQQDYELYLPEVNIPLATAHMDDLIDRVGDSFILRTSSYNATVEKTLEWRQRLYTGNVYEFMEEIPFDETRSYVRLVMRNYIMNLRLNSGGQPVEFPESLLTL